MKNKKTIILLIVQLLLPQFQAQVQASNSQNIGDKIFALVTRYDEQRKRIDPDPVTGGDIVMDCVDYTFRKWTKAYLSVLERENIDIKNMAPIMEKLKRFGLRWFVVGPKLEMAEHMRPGIIATLENYLQSVYSTPGFKLNDLNESKMSFNEVLEQDYNSNLSFCLSKHFKREIMNVAGKLDETYFPDDSITHIDESDVEWVQSSKGGIKPQLIPNSNRQMFRIFQPSYKTHKGRFDYEKFLSDSVILGDNHE